MPTTRLALQTEIYGILGKEATAFGYFTPAKVNAAIQDALDYIASKMMRVGTAWLTKRAFANIVANTQTVALPTDLALINFIKKKTAANDYQPITFDENATAASSTTPSGGLIGLPIYHIVNNAIFLEPIPDENITDGLLIEYVAFPAALTSDSDNLPTELDKAAFVQYAKWRAAKQLYVQGNQHGAMPAWMQYEQEWLMEVQTVIAKRIRMPSYKLAFANY
jgi:hypothetical protein